MLTAQKARAALADVQWVRVLLAAYFLIVAVWALDVAGRPDYYGNVAFLVLGALIGIFPLLVMGEFQRVRENREITIAVFHELANRVGRCCFDFEHPWSAQLNRQSEAARKWVLKFRPDPPTIYPAVAGKIGRLPGNAAQPVITFYIAVAAWHREIESAVAEAGFLAEGIDNRSVRLLARRLRRTLLPGKRALEALAPYVPHADEIERLAMRDGDELFAIHHPNAGKTFRERIADALASTQDDPSDTPAKGVA